MKHHINCHTLPQVIIEVLLSAAAVGLVFAVISQPKHRGSAIYISDSACVARRDGILKFMFRIADVRRTQASGRPKAAPVWALRTAHDNKSNSTLDAGHRPQGHGLDVHVGRGPEDRRGGVHTW